MASINTLWQRAAQSLLLAIAVCSGNVAAGAEGALPFFYEAKFGVLAHDVPDLWSGFKLERGIDINAEILFAPSLPFLWGDIRPAIGGTVNTAGHTSKAYAGVRWQIETASGLYFGAGLGATVHDGHINPDAIDRKALGARVLFHIPFEIGYRFDQHNSLSVYFEHMSNGNTHRYNEELDSLGVHYAYRF
jgi:lipid A 3-O-deacylase